MIFPVLLCELFLARIHWRTSSKQTQLKIRSSVTTYLCWQTCCWRTVRGGCWQLTALCSAPLEGKWGSPVSLQQHGWLLQVSCITRQSRNTAAALLATAESSCTCRTAPIKLHAGTRQACACVWRVYLCVPQEPGAENMCDAAVCALTSVPSALSLLLYLLLAGSTGVSCASSLCCQWSPPV